jgi:hypothetical protein
MVVYVGLFYPVLRVLLLPRPSIHETLTRNLIQDTLTITADGVSSVHETYAEGRASSHDEDKCEFCLRRPQSTPNYAPFGAF